MMTINENGDAEFFPSYPYYSLVHLRYHSLLDYLERRGSNEN